MTKMTIEVTPLQAAVVEAMDSGADLNICKFSLDTNAEARQFLAPFVQEYGRMRHRKRHGYTTWSVGNGVGGATVFINQRRPDHG